MNENDIQERESTYLIQTYKRQPVTFRSGEGCWLIDDTGKRYLDFVAGVAVMSLGHSHPAWVSAVQQQAATLVHTSNLFYTEPMVNLAQKLPAISGMQRAFFCNSGTEANEAAIKIARKWGKQKRGRDCFKFITFERGFHGRTLGALSATGNLKYCAPFEPLVPGFIQIPANNIAQVEALLDGSVCGILFEPIQGEGGVYQLDLQFIKQLREVCDRHEVLLIADEVQTGIARTGRWLGFQHAGITPDLCALAKGLGGGFPIGACLANGEAATTLAPGDHGSTYAANPLATTAALAVLETIEKTGLLSAVAERGMYFESKLKQLITKLPKVCKEIRGQGLLRALELHEPKARKVVESALHEGLLLNATSDTCMRFTPPLIVIDAEIDQAFEILERALS